MQVVVVTGGNLFALALEHLGSATRWTDLAAANQLLDPMLEGIVALKIPTTQTLSNNWRGGQ